MTYYHFMRKVFGKGWMTAEGIIGMWLFFAAVYATVQIVFHFIG